MFLFVLFYTQPKYIAGLLKSAAARKREFERTVERQVQKEREKEQGEFDDKEAFVTEAYPLKFQFLQELHVNNFHIEAWVMSGLIVAVLD